MKLADVSISRPVFAAMMIFTILVFGLTSMPKIGIDLFPDIEYPVITILTVYPGASPTAVEEKVTKKIEESVNTLSDIETLVSYSSENVSQVIVRFKLEANVDKALQDVRDKIAFVRNDLPLDIEDPLVQKLDLGALPILTYSVTGPPDMSNVALTEFADKVLKAEIQKASGVGRVELIGGRPRKIHLLVDPVALSAANLTVEDLMALFGAENIELPGGRFELKTRELSLRVDNQIRDPREIGNIELTRINGAPIFLRDVAQVVDAEKEARSFAAVGGKPAVLIQVLKQSGANVVATADAVKKAVAKIEKSFPKSVKVSLVSDNAKFISEAIRDSVFDLLYGALLAVLIIGLFLRNRQMTMISAVAIPTSIIGAFTVIRALGFTFNYMTMVGLALSVGIVIDDAIVVIENIFRHIERGEKPMEAARKGTHEIGLAVMATTFTIVAVFVPVAFMEGMVGRFFYQFGVTVAVAVLISLFVSFTLTPMLSSRFVRHKERHGGFFKMVERLLKGLDEIYARIISLALKHRLRTVLIAVTFLALSFVVVSFVPSEFIPEQDEEKFEVKVETPPGSTLEHTQNICAAVEKMVGQLPGVELITTTVGGGSQEKVNEGQLFVTLAPADEREYSQKELMSMARRKVEGITGAVVTVKTAMELGGGSFRTEPIQFVIRGEDLPNMEAAALRIVEKLKKVKGFVDVDSTVRAGKDELRIRVDRDKASQMGVKPAQVAMAIRNLVSSAKVGEMAQGEDRYDVLVWLPKERRSSTAGLDLIKVRNQMGQLVSLADLVTFTPSKSPTEIERQDRQRQVVIVSNLEGLPLANARDIVEKVARDEVPPGLTTTFVGDIEFMQESFKSMINALFLAIILVYIILASQFNSFVHPFTIMLSLPFSVIGAFGALLVSGYTLSMISMIGIIMLMGLVTKNAILLVDRANQNISKGLDRTAALVDAGRVRLRPILMTTFAMIFGMLPIALALSKGSEIRAPMATAVIGGLITSTLLTLVVVPVVYTFLDDLQRKISSLFRRPTLHKSEAGD